MTAAEHQIQYLQTEFAKYFPSASIIVDNTSEEETIIVTLQYPDDPISREFRMEIGSDDDWYEFTDGHGVLLMLPLIAHEVG